MKSKTILTLLLITVLGSACSMKKKETQVIGDNEVAKEEEALLLVDNYEADELFEIDAQALDFGDELAEEQSAPIMETQPIISTNSYTVVEGDTLMYVAYKMYGDYKMWRSIASMNGMGSSQTNLQTGAVLQIDSSKVRPMPFIDGTPYLIRGGDTLGKISIQQYGNPQRWEALWKHNAEMIQDPNVIFAGFQMYLLPDGSIAAN